MHKVELKVEGEKIMWIQPNLRLLEKGAPFVEFTRSMLNGTYEMHRYLTPVTTQIMAVVVPHIADASWVSIEPFRFRVDPKTKAAWNDLLPGITRVIQGNVRDKIGVKVIGNEKWPIQILQGKKL